MKMKFTRSSFDEIRRTVGSQKCETGGILLGNRNDFVVQKFVFDPHGSTFSAGYDPNVEFINRVIKDEWENNELALIGFVHSHPRGCNRLSGDYGNNTGDLGYLKAIFKAIPALDRFLVPIVFSKYDGLDFRLIPFVAQSNNIEGYIDDGYDIIPDNEYYANPEVFTLEEEVDAGLKDNSRLVGAVDIALMEKTHIVGVGCGGACTLYENLVRSGLGKLTIIDYDIVDASNITTQGYYNTEIGLPKVEALKNRLQQINPNITINAIQGDFLQLKDKKIAKICTDANLLMMMTDNFQAQARGNIISLQYHIPAIFAMMYEKARASEVMFTIPGVTPNCFRCATSNRYQAYEGGYENDIRSVGSTIFHTYYLNSVIGLVALAVLHNRTVGFEFSNWFGDRWDRNFIQIRNHPHYSNNPESLFGRVLGNIPHIYNFDAIWQKIEAEKPPMYDYHCPDCGGKGIQESVHTSQ